MICKLSYFVLIANLLSIASTQMITEEICDADDIAMIQWYRQVNTYIHTNQNNSQHIKEINEKLDVRNQEIQQTLDKFQREQQRQLAQVGDIAMLKEKLNRLEKQLQEIHQKSNGNIVIQRRQDGSVNFFREWDEYKRGFGNVSGEFFLGLEKLHKLTNSRPYALLIVMEDWDNDRRYAKYDQFIVASEKELYTLKSIGTYSGSAGDSLAPQLGQKFSTKDRDNDSSGSQHCAVVYSGAWWYSACHESNLNGRYLKGSHTEYATSVIWYKFKGHNYSLKFVEMTLIPK